MFDQLILSSYSVKLSYFPKFTFKFLMVHKKWLQDLKNFDFACTMTTNLDTIAQMHQLVSFYISQKKSKIDCYQLKNPEKGRQSFEQRWQSKDGGFFPRWCITSHIMHYIVWSHGYLWVFILIKNTRQPYFIQ